MGTGRLEGRVAVVTGAAKGIGRSAALRFAEEGAKVVCTDMDEDAGYKVADEIGAAGGDAVFVPHNVVEEADWEKVVSTAESRYGPLNVLVNNAGIAPSGKPIEELALEEWRHTVAVDLDSVFLGCKHAIRSMKKGKAGSIINISSIMGLVGTTNAADYNAAKGGVRLLTKVAALECAEAGYPIRVNSVHPGYIDTPLVRNALDRGVSEGRMASANEMVDLLVMLHPIGRLGAPMEIANALLFLASDESSFVTGSELVVDGGYTAR